ncbi:peptide chain release factor 1 [Aquipuribacter nitratireducens]|uniref:Peptide chain release factor 1 n=1 Tax=Aquipuribacter nitratireducens TaxID=650104 RepID=A0ABW0GLP7_9MICO
MSADERGAADVPADLAAVRPLLDEHAELEAALGDPAVHADPAQARRLTRRYAQLGRVAAAHRDWASAREDLATARELAAEDPDIRAEVPALELALAEATERLRTLLVPRDPDDDRDAIVEVRAGEGGTESALFAAELVRMYQRWAERHGWRTQLLDTTWADLGGVKAATLAVAAPEGAYGMLRHEGGVHRVQRVPVTESAGRIHTSAVGVLVSPEAEDVEVDLDPADLRVDVFRSSGPGGQSVNTTDSAVRITHLPTGTVVSCQNEKSQLQNREQALRVLRARLLADARAAASDAASQARAAQVRTVDRSERVRTYNFGENRVVDHRSGYKAYNLDQVLDGDLDPVVDSLVQLRTREALAAASEAGAGA